MPMKNDFTFIFFLNEIWFKPPADIIPSDELFDSDLAENVEWFSPSQNTVRRIIDFACSYDVVDTKSSGQVELTLN
jgi:hypothetical protein